MSELGYKLAATKTVVETTRQGRGLYASEGFLVEIEHYVVQLSDAFWREIRKVSHG